MDMNALDPSGSDLRIPESPEVLAHADHARTAERAAVVLSSVVVALMVAASAVGLFVLYPTEESWADGDRAVTCIATSESDRTGSLNG